MPATKTVLVPIHQDGLRADIGIRMSVQCASCTHLQLALKCKAFPKGIPEAVLNGKYDHRKPYKGDHGVRFERIK